MNTSLEAYWENLSEILKPTAQLGDQISKSLRGVVDAGNKGEVHVIDQRLGDAKLQLENLGQAISNLNTQLNSHRRDFDDLQNLILVVEAKLKELNSGQVVYSIGNKIIAFPIVIEFEMTKRGIQVNLGGMSIRSSRPTAIIDFVNNQLKKTFNTGSFLKSVHKAHEYLSRGQSEAAVSLEDIRQLIALTPEGQNSYTQQEFNADLQRLNALPGLEVGGLIATLSGSPAAKVQYPIFLETGNFINVAQIRFIQIEKKPENK